MIFEKLRYDGKPLPQEINDNLFHYNGHEYDLYTLLPEIAQASQTFSNLSKVLPDFSRFKTEFYTQKGRIRVKPISEIYWTLIYGDIDIEQLHFCLDYAIHEQREEVFHLSPSILVSDALDMVLKNNFKGFDHHWTIPGFKNNQIYARPDLLTEEERLPSALFHWLEENPQAKYLMATLIDESNPHIQLRKAVMDNQRYSIDNSITDNAKLLANTIDWITQKAGAIQYKNNKFNLLLTFIDLITENKNLRYGLKYTGLLDKDNQEPTFVFTKQYRDAYYFLCDDDWNKDFRTRLSDSTLVSEFFQNNDVFYTKDKDFLASEFLKGRALKLKDRAEANSICQEWTDKKYQLWRETASSENVAIYLSPDPIPIIFSISTYTGAELLRVQLHSRNIGYEIEERKIILRYPNEDNLSVRKSLTTYAKDLKVFQSAIISLQDFLLEDFQEVEKLAQSKGEDISEVVNRAMEYLKGDIPAKGPMETEESSGLNAHQQTILDAFTNYSDEQLKKLQENPDALNLILDNLDTEDIQDIAQNLEDYKEIRQEKEEAEDESKQSKVRKTIGYIGELIYQNYLQNKLNKELRYAADEGIQEYDFLNQSDNVYIDVKTTLYSIKNGVAPFYLHKAQIKFMQENPDVKYKIARISLKDLSLEKSYETIRAAFESDEDPRENERLRKECKRIADRYWKQAQIDEFESDSPQYAIKVKKSNER